MESKPTLTCDYCTFETKSEVALKKHSDRHDEVDETENKIEDLEGVENKSMTKVLCILYGKLLLLLTINFNFQVFSGGIVVNVTSH